jgi:hypothetical protein
MGLSSIRERTSPMNGVKQFLCLVSRVGNLGRIIRLWGANQNFAQANSFGFASGDRIGVGPRVFRRVR